MVCVHACACACACVYVCVCVCVCLCVRVRHLLVLIIILFLLIHLYIGGPLLRLTMCSSLTPFLLLSLLLYAMGTHAQTYPRMEYTQSGMSNRTVVPNNSFVNRGTLGTSTALTCLTNLASCCTNPVQGNWINPDGSPVYQGQPGAMNFYVTRDSGAVRLNRTSRGSGSDSNGIWRCDIPDVSGISRSIYVYLGDSESGEW